MKKKAYIIIGGLFLFLASCKKEDCGPNHSQPKFNKVYGGTSEDAALAIIASADGGYVMAGLTLSNDGDVSGKNTVSETADAWVVKIDKGGNIVWQKTIGGSGQDVARSITSGADGGYVIAGETQSNDGDVSGNHGKEDAWLVKLDKSGNIIWQKTLGGSEADGAFSVVTVSGGGYVMAGYTSSNDGDVSVNHGYYDAWVVEVDGSGNILWQKTLGGSGGEGARSIIPSFDGGYLMVGETNSNDGEVSGNHGLDDVWVVKIDNSGNKVWQKTLGGADFDQGTHITGSADGGYVIAGYSYSNDGDVSGNHGIADAWLIKLNGSGNIVWQKTLGGANFDGATSIINDSHGGYIMTGVTSSNDGDLSGNHGKEDGWVVRLDGIGNIVSQKNVGGTEFDAISAVVPAHGGGYVMAGTTLSNDGDVSGNHGNYDAWALME